MAYMGDMIDRNPMDKVERPKPRKGEAKAEAPADESKGSTEPTSDSGIVALAVVASLAVAGAVVIKKSR